MECVETRRLGFKQPRCQRCRERWPQSSNGLCRRCERETGFVAGMTPAEVKERVLLTEAAQRAYDEAMAPRRTTAVDGQEFEVMWDGAIR